MRRPHNNDKTAICNVQVACLLDFPPCTDLCQSQNSYLNCSVPSHLGCAKQAESLYYLYKCDLPRFLIDARPCRPSAGAVLDLPGLTFATLRPKGQVVGSLGTRHICKCHSHESWPEKMSLLSLSWFIDAFVVCGRTVRQKNSYSWQALRDVHQGYICKRKAHMSLSHSKA